MGLAVDGEKKSAPTEQDEKDEKYGDADDDVVPKTEEKDPPSPNALETDTCNGTCDIVKLLCHVQMYWFYVMTSVYVYYSHDSS